MTTSIQNTMKQLKQSIWIMICMMSAINVQSQLSGGGEANPDLPTHREALEKFKKRAANGLNIWEKIRTGVDFGTLGGEIVGQLEDVKNEVLDLNELEMEELAKHIAEKLDMEYNQAMQAISVIVIEFIDLAISAQKIYTNIKRLL